MSSQLEFDIFCNDLMTEVSSWPWLTELPLLAEAVEKLRR